jgi:hypothetical protein
MRLQQETFAAHLSQLLHWVDIRENGELLPFSTNEEKRATLTLLSLEDLQEINQQINAHGSDSEDLKKTGIDSSAGPAPKEE